MKAASRTSLIKKLDKLFSRYVRQKYANEGGWVECVTCRAWMPWEQSQAGHFVKRGHHAVRWDEQNVHPQCPRCNLYLNGAQDEYAAYILNEYGPETLKRLLDAKRVSKRWTVGELREMVDRFS